MQTTTVKMTLTKSTKGTHVYGNTEPDIAVPSLYIKKASLPIPLVDNVRKAMGVVK